MKMARASEKRLCALILMLNSLGCTQMYLRSSCDARFVYARMIDLTGFCLRCSFKQ